MLPPGQIVVELEVAVTVGATVDVTVMVTPEEVTTAGEAHAAVLVISTEYTSPLDAPDVVYVAFVAPEIYALPNFHL